VVGDELTPTLKLRRGAVVARYHDLIERLYAAGGAP
jgi:long-subunit acyl-CoA synthetase (AMP-forming)